MIKIALIGAGKMGISHLSILGAHPDVEVVGVCDTSKMTVDFLSRYGKYKCYSDYRNMIRETKPQAVVVAVPTKYHFPIIKDLLESGLHIFAEKPFCISTAQQQELIALAAKKNVVNQVGYHNKFIGTFAEAKKIVASGALGVVHHFVGEAYGPVVTKAKQDTWRSHPEEGGGCLLDYASHVIDLVNDILAPVTGVKGSVLNSIYSKHVEDAVYSLLELSNKVCGVLSVNWSDETYRKMSTTITISGTKGKVIVDASELKVFFKEDSAFENYTKGWNITYITELTNKVDFYLRGEEYSIQMDYFVRSILGKVPNTINTFQDAWYADRAIEMIKNSAK